MTGDLGFLEPRAVRSLRWTAAAVCVVTLHAAAAAALITRDVFDTDTSGSVAIELAPVTTALSLEEQPLEQAPRRVEKPHEEPQPLPVEPSPLAPNPEVTAAPTRAPEQDKPTPEEKVEEKAETEQPLLVPVPPSPPSEAPPAETTAAPSAGLSGAAAQAQATWFKELSERINRYKRYPEAARRGHRAGLVKLAFTVDRAGEVLTARIVESSGSPVLDAEAIAMLNRARPLPLPPPQMPDSNFDLVLPVSFELR